MLELTGLGSVLRGIGVLYWLAALAFLIGAVMSPRTRAGKAIAVAITLAAFAYLPGSDYVEQQKRAAFEREAWAYFKNKCATEAGEKIYKTFSGVKSVLVVKPLPPATEKDLYDQFWYGDPYSNTSTLRREKYHALALLERTSVASKKEGTGFEFFEVASKNSAAAFTQVRKSSVAPFWTESPNYITPVSRFGIAWLDISKPEDRRYWVAGSKLQILDLSDNSVLAERIGFFVETGFGSTAGQRRPWQSSHSATTTCPPISTSGFSDNWFIFSVLAPFQGAPNGK